MAAIPVRKYWETRPKCRTEEARTGDKKEGRKKGLTETTGRANMEEHQ